MGVFKKNIFLFLILIFLSTFVFSFCDLGTYPGCSPTGSACSTDSDCISKLCVESICQPNHSQTLEINKIWDDGNLFQQVHLTSQTEPKFVIIYNRYVSGNLRSSVSILKKVGNAWVNNIRYTTENSNYDIFGGASGYFEDGSNLLFNVGRSYSSGSTEYYYELFGGENTSNTIIQMKSKPSTYSSKYYKIGDFFAPRFRINQDNKSINLICVGQDEPQLYIPGLSYFEYHQELIYGNPKTDFFPSTVHRFTDYSASMVSYSCSQHPLVFDKKGDKVAISVHDGPVNVINLACPYKYCEGGASFPYSCTCLNELNLYHDPFVKINSDGNSVLFTFSGNNLKECTQNGSGFDCSNYVLDGLNFSFPNHLLQSVFKNMMDVEIINNVPYIAMVVDSAKLMLCSKNISNEYDCEIVVDVNYLIESNDRSTEQGYTLIREVELSSLNGKLLISYTIDSWPNLFNENGLYLTEYTLPVPCVTSGNDCTLDSDCCNNECFRGKCSSCGISDSICPDNCTFLTDLDCTCGNGNIDEGENCSNCPEDVICQNDYYCEEGICIKDELDCSSDGVCNEDCPIGVDLDCGCVSVDGSCVSNSDCCSGLVCGAENKCVSTSSASTSIDVFNLFVDGNKLYYKIKCNKEVPIDINLYKGEVSSKNLVRVNDVCGVEEKNGLILDSVEEKIIYTAIAKIQPLCKVCTKTDYLVVEDLVNPTSVPDNSLIFTIVVLLSVVFLLNKKYNIKK